MAAKKIPIGLLQPGMFLIGVDVGWMDTPFLRHKFMIKNSDQIAKLRACKVQTVTIDPERGLDVELPQEPPPATQDQSEPPAVEQNGEADPSPTPTQSTSSPAPSAEATQQPEPQPERPASASRPAPTASKSGDEIRVPTAPTTFEVEHERVKKIKNVATEMMHKAVDSVRRGEAIDREAFGPIIEHTLGATKRNGVAVLSILAREPKTQGMIQHAFNQTSLATMLGGSIGLQGDQLRRLGMAAMFMDIGWVNVPSNLLRQQLGSYTEDEFDMVRDHLAHSVDILDKAEFESPVISIVERHHERFDGSGYPDGISGDEIPIEAQILSIISHYQGSVNGLYDSAPKIPVKVLQQIYQVAVKGGHNMELVKHFIHLMGIYPISSAVELNTGEKGIVTRINWRAPKQPRIKIVYGRSRNPLPAPREIDLATQNDDQERREVKGVIDPRSPAVDPRGLLVYMEE
jgi:HD-GYP domain-containing protein (c-di-GMP phosphodiesterase class II)